MIKNKIINGDCIEVLKTLPDGIVNTCVTSPPYFGLRDYGVDGQIGLEETPDAYVQRLVEVFREVRRVLRDDGTLWLNLGDSYASGGISPPSNKSTMQGTRPLSGKNIIRKASGSLKPKDLIGIPWRVAFALQADGWYLRQDIIWHKPNPMPESVTDRCTKSHEYIFLLSKSKSYYYDYEAIKEESVDFENSSKRYEHSFGGSKNEQLLETGQVHTRPIGNREFDGKRNKRDVWTVTTKPFSEAHFATFPKDLIRPCIRAGCPANGIVIDPFIGSGTTACVCIEENRNYLGIELNHKYIKIAENRIESTERAGLIDFGEEE